MAGCLARKLLKLIFWIINFSVWVASCALIGLGSWMLADSARFSTLFAEDNITPLAGMILGLGCFCFLVGFCGCRGAMLVDEGEGAIYLKVYFFLMLIVVLGELVAGILLIVFSDEVEESMTKGMKDTIMDDYGITTAANESVDLMQNENNCCGAVGPEDYKYSYYANTTGADLVPRSCCVSDDAASCNGTEAANEAHQMGCVEATIEGIEDNIIIIAGVTLGVAAVEIFAMIISCCLINDIEKDGATV